MHSDTWGFQRNGMTALVLAVMAAAYVLAPTATVAAEGSPDAAALLAELKHYKARIVFESYRNKNWELMLVTADGSRLTNLTSTPDQHEMYPKVSPDGGKIAFVSDEGQGAAKLRKLHVIGFDGSGRRLVADRARQPFWSPDGKTLGYLRSELKTYNAKDYATKGVVFYDLATGKHRAHPNEKLHHLYNPCWSPCGKWVFSTVHAGMGYKHGILAIEVDGERVINLKIPGCRPDISPDGKHVAWGASDYVIRAATIDWSGDVPKLEDPRPIVTSRKPVKIYHADWSPDGKYLAFSRGPKATKKRLGGLVYEIVGTVAPKWNLCVADASTLNRWVQIVSDDLSNKEPDWVPAGRP